jgi:hypothetical protein
MNVYRDRLSALRRRQTALRRAWLWSDDVTARSGIDGRAVSAGAKLYRKLNNTFYVFSAPRNSWWCAVVSWDARHATAATRST